VTVTTDLDARAYFCALWVQNEIYNKKLLIPVRIAIVAVLLLISFALLPFREARAWVIRAVVCAVVLVAHSFYAKRTRKRVFSRAAEQTIARGGGPVRLEYRFGDEGFSMKKSGEPAQETAYRDVTGLCETGDVLLLLIGRQTIHALHKSDVADLPALAALLEEKTGCRRQSFAL